MSLSRKLVVLIGFLWNLDNIIFVWDNRLVYGVTKSLTWLLFLFYYLFLLSIFLCYLHDVYFIFFICFDFIKDTLFLFLFFRQLYVNKHTNINDIFVVEGHMARFVDWASHSTVERKHLKLFWRRNVHKRH